MLSPPRNIDDAAFLSFFKELPTGAYTVHVDDAQNIPLIVEGAWYFEWADKVVTVWPDAKPD
jgi:hypothetical protein